MRVAKDVADGREEANEDQRQSFDQSVDQCAAPTPTNRIAEEDALEADTCVQIFSVSAVMVGAVLTVIGLMQVLVAVKQVSTLADDVLAFTSVLFLTSCLSAYLAIRTRNRRRMHRLERFADTVFVIAMVMAVVSVLFATYAFTALT